MRQARCWETGSRKGTDAHIFRQNQFQRRSPCAVERLFFGNRLITNDAVFQNDTQTQKVTTSQTATSSDTMPGAKKKGGKEKRHLLRNMRALPLSSTTLLV